MAESSRSSAQSAKMSTRKTSNLSRDDLLEVLQEAIRRCQEAGVEIRVIEDDNEDGYGIVLAIPGVALVDGDLVAI